MKTNHQNYFNFFNFIKYLVVIFALLLPVSCNRTSGSQVEPPSPPPVPCGFVLVPSNDSSINLDELILKQEKSKASSNCLPYISTLIPLQKVEEVETNKEIVHEIKLNQESQYIRTEETHGDQVEKYLVHPGKLVNIFESNSEDQKQCDYRSDLDVEYTEVVADDFKNNKATYYVLILKEAIVNVLEDADCVVVKEKLKESQTVTQVNRSYKISDQLIKHLNNLKFVSLQKQSIAIPDNDSNIPGNVLSKDVYDLDSENGIITLHDFIDLSNFDYLMLTFF